MARPQPTMESMSAPDPSIADSGDAWLPPDTTSGDFGVPTYATTRPGAPTSVPPPPPPSGGTGYAFDIGGIDADPAADALDPSAMDTSEMGTGATGTGAMDAGGMGTGASTSPEAGPAPPTIPGSAAPTTPTVTHGRRRGHRIGSVLAAILVPALMIILGLSLIANSLVGGSNPSTSARASQPKTTTPRPKTTISKSASTGAAANDGTTPDATGPTEPAVITVVVPVIAVPAAGDPADRAAAIGQIFLTALADEDFRTARAMTDSDVDETAEQNLDAASLVPVTAGQIGPDLVAMRLVIIEYRTIGDQPTTTFVCARWNVNTASGRIEQLGSAPLGDPQPGKVVPGDLAVTLADECDAVPLG